jgi:hypothetical protein
MQALYNVRKDDSMLHSERPTDMLIRQQEANRKAVTYRNSETGRRHYCHYALFRAAFIRDILAIRKELRKREQEKHNV